MNDSNQITDLPPVAPLTPDINDCCLSGCSPCVFDLYDQALQRYRLQLQQWQQRQAGAQAPAGCDKV